MNISEKNKSFVELMAQVNLEKKIIDQYHSVGALEKVLVSSKANSWKLFISFTELIPNIVISKLIESIKSNFKEVNIEFVFIFTSATVSEILNEYWEVIIRPFNKVPSIFTFLKSAEWYLEENKLIIKATNSATFEMLERKKVKESLSQYLQVWTNQEVELLISVIEIDEGLNKFKEEMELENLNYAIEAMQNSLSDVEELELAIGQNRMLQYGKQINVAPRSLKEISEEEKNVTIQGCVSSIDVIELKSGRNLASIILTDFTDSIQIKLFVKNAKKDLPIINSIKKGMWIKAKGEVQFDTFAKELVLMAADINEIFMPVKEDLAPEKRVELHLHTNMSAMDGITPIKKLVEQAKNWGHKAIAVTDHGIVQAFPDAYEAGQKYGVKIIYGVEANVIDDGVPIVHNEQDRTLINDTYVIFDTETTGLSAVYNKIIEIGAVKIQNGEIIDKFSTFVDPKVTISEKITEITGITNEMVQGAPLQDEALLKFKDFIGDSILVAHNARFDIGFLNVGLKVLGEPGVTNPVIDTVELARFLYPSMKNYKLNTLCKALNIELNNHHRAYHDAEATGFLLWKMIIELLEKELTNLLDLNRNIGKGMYNKLRPFHATILVKNEVGLKNLYKIISASHIDFFYRNPRVTRSFLAKHREGLIIGTACDQGELFEAMLNKAPDEIDELAKFYDYFEIQPLKNYHHLIYKGIFQNINEIKNIHERIIELGNKLSIPVIATGDVHHLNKVDMLNRKILIYNQISGFRYHHVDDLPSAHFMTTDEMLEAFSYLDDKLAKEIVIDNPNKLIEDIEELKPFPDDLYAPVIEGADEEIRTMSYITAKSIYGDPLPELVEKRLEKELNSIINNGFSVIYLISHKLVNKSLEDGYLVGSRGSVGSSFVATMTKITEVNPLPPHYVCPKCKHNEFVLDGSVGSGFDLEDKSCPNCDINMVKDGHDIPFETFMGFQGDKVPDIDLNFSGEYQPKVHKYTEELFGSEYVYRAGTISTVAEKTAYGYVKKYVEENQLVYRNAEIQRLVEGCTGIKRTTGQHPGGLMVIPQYKDVYDFTPIQRPADDTSSETTTTHFDYHAISGRLLKLDILGHDDPTVIRMLQDLTGVDPKTIPVDDRNIYELFRSTEPLGITPDDINTNLGSLGIPEFGTKFVRQMLEDTKPTTFAELVRISGLSHGTDVWLNNAQSLIREDKAVLAEVISTRDDIMVYLIQMGLDPSKAFKIMERVRKGKGLQEEDIEEMKKYKVPTWYIDSCQKIKYMFPKAHAVAYVLMAVRIAYYKIYYPIYYYATYFSVRADEFDVKIMMAGTEKIKAKITEINDKGITASPKEKGLLTALEIALEMVARGFYFENVDLYKSDATKFIVNTDKNGLTPPFAAISGIGDSAARNIVDARTGGEFLSHEDFQVRAKASKTTVELLELHGCLKGLPETNQLSLF